MQHRNAYGYLIDLVEGELRGRQRAEVEAHVETCEDCGTWLATYSLISKVTQGASAHPDPNSIASYAIEPGNLSRRERSKLQDHLENCRSCAREYKVTCRALTRARGGGGKGRISDSLWSGEWKPALAAAAIFAVAVLLFIYAPGVTDQSEYRLSDQRLQGSRVVEATNRLVATNVQVEPNSDIVFRASQTVLGDDFSVSRGARLVIATTGASSDAPTNTGKSRGGNSS